MALSPNYGWAEPDNSSLVKNGAQDIRALGDAIDTSVWNVGYGQAGKNKIINGDFTINARNFTSVTTNATFTFDRWMLILTAGGGTVTCTPQTFTAGAAPVSGYEATNFVRIVTASQANTDARAAIENRIEDVRSFANQTITVSFYAKAASGTPNINASAIQVFGVGGSSDVETVVTKKTITTSWARYSFTMNVPSISGKTIAAGSYLRIRIWLSAGSNNNAATDTIGIQNNTFDIWGVQAEYGSQATPFQTATGTIQSELAACQRYFQVLNGSLAGYGTAGNAMANYFRHLVQTRVTPTVTITTNPTYTNSSLLTNDENSITGSRFYATVTSTDRFFATGFVYTLAAEL